MTKSTRIQIEERVTTVYGLLVRGASREEILRYGSDTWGITTRQTEDYLARATERFKALAAFVQAEEFGRARAQLHDLYGRNMKTQDYKAAHAVRKDLSEMLGLYPDSKVKHEHSGPDGSPIQVQRVLPDAELEARLRAVAQPRAEARAFPAPDDSPPDCD